MNPPTAEAVERIRQELAASLELLVGRVIGSQNSTDTVLQAMKGILRQGENAGNIPLGFYAYTAFTDPDNPGVVQVRMCQDFTKYPLDEADFEELMGRAPVQDDLHRINCTQAGDVGHFHCGWCLPHDSPRFECGCIAPRRA